MNLESFLGAVLALESVFLLVVSLRLVAAHDRIARAAELIRRAPTMVIYPATITCREWLARCERFVDEGVHK